MMMFAVTSMIFAAEGGKLTSSKTPIDPTETVTLTYDGTGTNFANWEPKCFVHAWLNAAEGKTLSKEYTTAWASCNGDGDYAGLDAKVKMTLVSKGKYTIDINIKNFFDVAEADLEKIGKLGIIVRAQYEGDNNKTNNMFINVAVSAGGGEGGGSGEGGEGGEEIKTKALQFVPGVWTTDDAVLAVWAWGKEAAGAWAKFAGEGDTLVANINEKADSVIFVRFETGAALDWNSTIWNRTDNLLLESCGIFFVNDWDKYSWCDAEGSGSGEGGELPAIYETMKLVPGIWNVDGAKFAVFTWGKNVKAEWSEFFAGTGDTLSAQINGNADSLVLVRFAGTVDAPTWENESENVWNKIDKILINHESLVYTVVNWADGQWTPYIPSDLIDGYYLVGTHNGWWNPTSADLFSLNTEAEGEEYQLSKTLTVGQGIKVAQVKDKEIIHWFQDDSYGNEYVVDAAHAGEVTIYFRPNHDGEGWELLEGYIFIMKNSATAIDNAEGEVKAVKVFRDGQLLIIKGEKVYNVMGAIIR